MFRGLTRSEQYIGFLLIGFISGLVTLRSCRPDSHQDVLLSGPVEYHERGQLVANKPAPETLLEGLVDGKVEINLAGAELLETLPGIGPSKAGAIVQYREQHGPFATVHELDNVPGIGEKTLESLLPLICLTAPAAAPSSGQPLPETTPSPALLGMASPPPSAVPVVEPPAAPAVINLNTASAEELATLDGIGEVLATRILQDRLQNGRFRNVDELARVKGIGPKLLERNRHRLTVR
ncbi:MAG: competence protein ComEA [Candidatus Sumerlaeota bacterium]|nr:competence protein ComEA [Candidatus Sumerlaeota bacterium]